jgi:prepilin-type N-terminal cleavage/methylation domain-containing protein
MLSTTIATSPRPAPRRANRAFTLLELLIVVVVITVITAILVPAMRGAKLKSGRVACAEQLRSIGVGMRGYMNDFNDIMPFATGFPSVGAAQMPPVPSIQYVMSQAGEITAANAWRCSSDNKGYERLSDNTWQPSYFVGEGTSYAYNTIVAGQKMNTTFLYNLFGGTDNSLNSIWLLYDMDKFHSDNGGVASKNILFGDLSVADANNISASSGQAPAGYTGH